MTKPQPLVIVRRDKFATFGLLAQAFASEPGVRLVWDRRVHQRRSNVAPSDPADRRRQDRRRVPSTNWEAHDYLLVNITETVPPEAGRIHSFAADADQQERVQDECRRDDDCRRDIEAAIRSDLTVLISGGDIVVRRSVAHRIHDHSERHARALVVVNGDSLFDGSVPGSSYSGVNGVESTNAGTILIEEVADLSWDQQSQLVQLLEWRAAQGWDPRNPSRDARTVSGTGHDLLARVAAREFRTDLFYRLNIIHIVLPLGLDSRALDISARDTTKA